MLNAQNFKTLDLNALSVPNAKTLTFGTPDTNAIIPFRNVKFFGLSCTVYTTKDLNFSTFFLSTITKKVLIKELFFNICTQMWS